MKSIQKHYFHIILLVSLLFNPISSFASKSLDFWNTLAFIEKIIDSNKHKNDIKIMMNRLEELIVEKEKLQGSNSDLKKEISSMRNELEILYTKNAKLFKELEIYKPQNLPEFKQSDITNKYFNVKRIFRLRSANCFDFNGDMSCMYQALNLDDNRTGYLLYKANRVFKVDTKIDKITSKDGEILEILTSLNAKKIRKWEKKNPDLLILLAT